MERNLAVADVAATDGVAGNAAGRDVVVDNEYMTLWYYPVAKIVYHVCHKFVYGDALRDCLMRGSDVLAAHQAQKWLSDDRNNSALHPDDVEWGKTVWFPRVLRAGWKYWAIVLPTKVIGQGSMKRLIADYAEHGLLAELFSEPEDAMKWLRRR